MAEGPLDQAFRETGQGGEGAATRRAHRGLRLAGRERASPKATPTGEGAPYLQPTEERRRSGSHYTPRSLTEPIVRHALEPAFARLGEKASPEAVLALKALDPACGSGAFLVEACRQLGARLEQAWNIMARKSRAYRPTRTRRCMRAASSRKNASMASTAIRWRSTSRGCRSGWRRSRATMSSPSSIMR